MTKLIIGTKSRQKINQLTEAFELPPSHFEQHIYLICDQHIFLTGRHNTG